LRWMGAPSPACSRQPIIGIAFRKKDVIGERRVPLELGNGRCGCDACSIHKQCTRISAVLTLGQSPAQTHIALGCRSMRRTTRRGHRLQQPLSDWSIVGFGLSTIMSDTPPVSTNFSEFVFPS
jgi:hypothetical protein